MIITWRLEFLDGPRRGQTLDIFDGLLIGRRSGCDLAILTGHLSRRHARFLCEGGSLFLEDLNSANGTFVNNRKISKQQLASGDHIRLDQIKLLISRMNSNIDEAPRENFSDDHHVANGPRIPHVRKSIWVFAVTFVIVAIASAAVVYRYYVNY